MERLADLSIEDNDGKYCTVCIYVCMYVRLYIYVSFLGMSGMTPYQIADRESFADVILVLSQFTTGFLGPLQVQRISPPGGEAPSFYCSIPITMHIYIHTYIHTYMQTYIRTYIHKYINTYIHT